MNGSPPPVEEPVDKTVSAIAQVHRQHYQSAPKIQHWLDAVTAVIGRPQSVGFLTLAVAAWVVGNLLAPRFGHPALDPPPFAWLELFASVSALVITGLILSTQRREDRLAEQRADLTLELAFLSEQRTAKIIALIEELRRDSPTVPDRQDTESEAMAQASDPEAMLATLEERRSESAS